MDDWKTILTGGTVGGAALVVVGRWVVPLLKRMLDNMVISVGASGDVLTNVRGERDHWKKAYDELAAKTDEVWHGWIEMKTKYDLLLYKLEQAEARSKECDSNYASLQAEMAQAKLRIQQLEKVS